MINPGAYLESFPPAHEVEIDEGPKGRGDILELFPRGGPVGGRLRLQHRRAGGMEPEVGEPLARGPQLPER